MLEWLRLWLIIYSLLLNSYNYNYNYNNRNNHNHNYNYNKYNYNKYNCRSIYLRLGIWLLLMYVMELLFAFIIILVGYYRDRIHLILNSKIILIKSLLINLLKNNHFSNRNHSIFDYKIIILIKYL